MSVFIDSGIFFGAYSKDDEHHNEAIKLLEQALGGDFGTVFTSDYIFDETVTLVMVKSKDVSVAICIGEAILASDRIKVLPVKSDIFDEAWQIFGQYGDKHFTFTDCTSIALIKKYKIDSVLSLDAEFNGVLEGVVDIKLK